MDVIELRARLRALAPTPEEAARKLGLPMGTVRAMLAGRLRPSETVAARIAKGARP